MEGADLAVVRVQGVPDGDEEELAELTRRLRVRLLELDVDGVDPLVEATGADRAKGPGAVVGWLAVRFGGAGLRTVLAAVAAWVTRTGRSVEVSYGGDTLKVTGVTSAQQEQIIDGFLARHTPSA